ncbi:hypothetical protein JAAARDRAFT_201246 [Jaapia argillacea MUCL 33604]|uniref:Uncharacterized protein n=1 Tax=Jaapia argillacea MUCL 33604 TaxID=933084 RepID=A0A067P2M1_9AGAM|nr:hypothetical protein JAAARDRAFT_201246 [Jaapia argillacea MUCL 33604]
MEDGDVEDGDDENLSADSTSDDDTEMLSNASIQRRKKSITKSSKGYLTSERHEGSKGVIKPNHSTSNRQKLPRGERAMSVVEISSGEDEDEPIVTFKASKSGNIGTLKQPSKKVTVSTHSSMKASTLPRTPSKKRNPRLESSDKKPKSAKKPRFYVDNETGKKEEGPVIIAPKKSQSDTNCKVTNIVDANEYLKDTYSGLTPLSAVAVVTGASSSEEKMVSLKDWAADGADMKYIVKLTLLLLTLAGLHILYDELVVLLNA